MKGGRRAKFVTSVIAFPILGLGLTILWMIYEESQIEYEFKGTDPDIAYGSISVRVLIPFAVGIVASVATAIIGLIGRSSSAHSD